MIRRLVWKLSLVLPLCLFLGAPVAVGQQPQNQQRKKQEKPTSRGQKPPLALMAAAESLGKGPSGTVVAIAARVAPEDRERVKDRAQVTITLLDGGTVIDRHSAVAEIESDGSLMLYRDWAPGTYELRVSISSLDNNATGIWIGDIEVLEIDTPFTAPEGALPDAVALQITPPREGAVAFLPPPDFGGIGAIQLEVEAPEETTLVEFFRNGELLGTRNRPPWTVSVSLGEVIRRTIITAVAKDANRNYLGEDALILNNPTGQLGLEILLGPEPKGLKEPQSVTVAVTGAASLVHVTLHLDDQQIARWAECPCIAEIPREKLESAAILAAEALDSEGTRGDAVITLFGESGFSGTVKVELVELPIVVLDGNDIPVTGLTAEDFKVYEDDQEVNVEGFGTTADLPLSLALAVDTSGSMLEIFPQVRRAVAGFTSSLLEEGDNAILITFAWEPVVSVKWTDAFEQIPEDLKHLIPEGGTSLHDTVVHTLEQFRGRRGRQAMVLLTDGEDTTSRTGWDVASRYARTMRIPVFPIGLGLGSFSFGSKKVLKELAEDSGGDHFFIKKVEQLPAAYARISELLRSQYLIWYSSNSNKPEEEFRTIRVEVANPNYKVKTISGYYPGK
jgi:Ca-activated chloride channel family protein